MCGIIGVVGRRDAAGVLLEGLGRLTYRGYDSCGMATINGSGIERRRAAGRVKNLERILMEDALPGRTGIAHTRWATHGVPNESNAHPHGNGRVTIVHNGIIENFRALRDELEAEGHQFETETDSEAIVHLIVSALERGQSPDAAMDWTFRRLEGAFAVAAIMADAPDSVFALRHGCPLAVGLGDQDTWVGSDPMAFQGYADRVVYLEEGDRAHLTADTHTIRDIDGSKVSRGIVTGSSSPATFSKGKFRHYMLKEIHEQPIVVGDTLRSYLDTRSLQAVLPSLPVDFADLDQLLIVGCGSSSFAAGVAGRWFEEWARLSTRVEIASEFRYRKPVLGDRTAALLVSQSGETADTLAALRKLRESGVPCLAMVNVEGSTLAREADAMIPIHAGPEISVASTKSFTAQLATFACLVLGAARRRRTLDSTSEARLVTELLGVPAKMVDALADQEAALRIAFDLQHVRHVLYLGRGTSVELAREGALKMKEVSYIHAEAYPAGELKHGPIALVDPTVPAIFVAPCDLLLPKVISNLEEVAVRGGRIVLVSDREGLARVGDRVWHELEIPASDPFVTPLVAAISMQLLAYHTAVLKGTDVDQPRNLAKSVTVE